MAKIDPTSLFTEIRGTVGGLTFSRNRAGSFVKRLYFGIPSKRPAPQARRAAFTAAAVYWTEHRDELYTHPTYGSIPVSAWWNYFAQEPGNEKIDLFGGTYKPSGYNWFITYAVMQSMAARDPLLLPPTDTTPAQWPAWSVTYEKTGSASNTRFVASSTTLLQGTRPWITCRIQYNQSDTPLVGPFFFIKEFAYTTASALHTLQTELESVFGAVPNNSRAFFQVRFRIQDSKISAAETFSLLPGETYSYP